MTGRAALTGQDPAQVAELPTKAATIRRQHDRPATPTEAAMTAATAATVEPGH